MRENTMDRRDIISLSFGAGVQSTTLLMLIINRDQRLLDAIGGEEHLPTEVIFADPGAESEGTYQHIEDMKARCADAGLGFSVVTYGSLTTAIEDASQFSIPAFVRMKNSQIGMLHRTCTHKHKVLPIQRRLKALMGYQKGQVVKHTAYSWTGISIDEIQRVKPSRTRWEERCFPLVDMMWDRVNCLNYLAEIGMSTVGKSACVYCPYHSDSYWLDMKRKDPAGWEEACRVDELIRDPDWMERSGLRGVPYLHKACEPLRDLELGENQLNLLDMFDNECEGMCGL